MSTWVGGLGGPSGPGGPGGIRGAGVVKTVLFSISIAVASLR